MACATLGWIGSSSAYYEESHITADEVRITVDGAGAARFEHILTWRLVAGQPHAFDLVGTEPSAVPEPTTALEADDGKMLTASVAAVPGRGVRVTIATPKGLHHGQQYRVKVAYAVNLLESGELVRDGSSYRLAWKAPVPAEGLEGPRVTFALPAALEAPGALMGADGMRDDGVTSTLRRAPDHDEVELMRPHVGRGEDVVWAVRVDAKAFGVGHTAEAAPPPPPRHDPPPGPLPHVYAVLAALGLVYAAAIRLKERWFSSLAGSLAKARGLVPLASWERAALGGALLFVGTSLQLVDAPLAGAAAVVAAMVSAVLVAPAPQLPARGPGRWLVLRPEEAFAPHRRVRPLAVIAWLFAVTGSVACFLVAGRLLASTQPELSLVLPLDALALVPVIATGLPSQLPPDRAGRGAWLGRLFRRLVRVKGLRVSPWARVPTGLSEPDEVRVRVVPRDPLPGLSGIEVGFAFRHAATSFASAPEVWVRVEEATAAAARMLFLAPEVTPVPGRRPEERVYRLAPAVPTRRETLALVRSLGMAMIDRRREVAPWESEERRVPPAERALAPAPA